MVAIGKKRTDENGDGQMATPCGLEKPVDVCQQIRPIIGEWDRVNKHLWAICQIKIPFPLFVRTAVQKIADMSFSLYLLHLPIIYMLAYSLRNERSVAFVFMSLPLIFGTSYVFSRATEANRGTLRAWVEAVASHASIV
jgi:hypothetical protein